MSSSSINLIEGNVIFSGAGSLGLNANGFVGERFVIASPASVILGPVSEQSRMNSIYTASLTDIGEISGLNAQSFGS